MKTKMLAALLALFPLAAQAQSVVTLQPSKEDGRYTIETTGNGVGVRPY